MTKNEFLFFTTGKQTRSIIARVESLTFRLPPLIITLRRGVSYRLNVDPTWSTPRVNRYARVNFTNIINDYPYRHESPLRDNTTAIVIALSSIPRKSSCACINEVNPFHYSYRTPPYHCSRPSKGAGWESKAYCDSSSPNDSVNPSSIGRIFCFHLKLSLSVIKEKKIKKISSRLPFFFRGYDTRCNVSFSKGRLISMRIVSRMQWSRCIRGENMHILKNNADAEGTPRPTDTNVLLE